MLFNYALQYAIRRVQVNKDGLKLNGTHQLLVYADDVNIVGGSVHTIKKNTGALIAASKETGLQVNAVKTKYMVMSRDQNARGSHNAKIDNSSFERVEEFRYLTKTLTDKNSIQVEIESRLKSGNACHHSVQNLLSSSLLSNSTEIVLSRTITLPVVLYGRATWSLRVTEECGLRMFENRVRRRIFGHSSNEVTGEWRELRNEELNNLYSSPMIILVIKSEE